MHHAFEAAFRVAKRVASDTEINRRRVSIPSIAVADYAKQLFETLDDKKILVIGAGEMGEETLRYLRAEGARQIVVLNRSRERAERMAEMFQAEVDDWLQLQARVAWADLIVSTTGAHEPLVTEQQFREIQQSRSERPLFILDLAVPRDFHPGIAQFTNVYLYSIDDLRSVCEANRKAREKHWPKADRIVREETTRFIAERNHRATAPTIQRLKQRAEELKQLELARLLHKLGPVDPQVQQEIEQSFDRLVNKLLHSPLQSLRGEAEKGSPQGLLSALRHLFQISD
jgi:glutamyl-tRNA reductase